MRSLAPVTIAVGSLVLLGGLAATMLWRDTPASSEPLARPIIVYVAPAVLPPMEEIAGNYHKETGQRILIRPGPSETILTQAGMANPAEPADLFLPADDSYIRLARERGLIAETIPIATMKPLLMLAWDNPAKIETWADLLKDDVKVAIPGPGTAVGKLTREHLARKGLWDAIAPRVVDTGTVTEAANAAKVGSVSAAVLFDAVAAAPNYSPHPQRHPPELDGITARVEIGVLKQSADPTAALRFARYATAKDRGLKVFRDHGYHVVEPADTWAENPEVLLYAGAMLRPAIDDTVTAFEKREGVRVTRVYNGCGILVNGMQAGARPDAFFACDSRFMREAESWFGPSEIVSNNILVIAVPKGNPRNVKTLKDMGLPGLRVGVGHEQQCALGGITKETLEFVGGGTYAAVRKNVVVESATGDTLVNQLRTGSLDAVIAYISNVKPFDDLDAIPVTGIACAAPTQPYAIGKTSSYPQLALRLKETLRDADSRAKFEKLGFGWGEKK